MAFIVAVVPRFDLRREVGAHVCLARRMRLLFNRERLMMLVLMVLLVLILSLRLR